MALTLGRVLFVGDSTHEVTRFQRPRSQGKVVASEITDAAARVQQMLAQTEAQIAEKWANFESARNATETQMLHQVRAQAECLLAAQFIELSTLRQREIESSRKDVIELARLLAERVLRHELSTDPSKLIQLAEQCIAEASGSTSVRIRMNPDDIFVVREPLQTLLDGRISLELVPDPEFDRGDLHVESDIGTLDARLGTQLANLVDALRGSFQP